MVQNLVVGIDEVGRGCWAGPLVAAAVLLNEPIDGLGDSKKISKKRREILAEIIKNEAKAYGVGWVSADEIDRIGLSKAVQLAMLRAIKCLHESGVSYKTIIIDGNINYLCDRSDLSHVGVEERVRLQQFLHVIGRTCHIEAVVRADGSVSAVSAASILAKVERDAYMTELAAQYPEFGFDRHVGYGTAAHIAALAQHGPLETIHRYSYAPVQKYIAQ